MPLQLGGSVQVRLQRVKVAADSPSVLCSLVEGWRGQVSLGTQNWEGAAGRFWAALPVAEPRGSGPPSPHSHGCGDPAAPVTCGTPVQSSPLFWSLTETALSCPPGPSAQLGLTCRLAHGARLLLLAFLLPLTL